VVHSVWERLAGLGGHGPLAPLRQVLRGVRVLAPANADAGRCLGLDQFLQQPLGDLADELKPIGRT
jgi:hypothetical protein